MQNLTCCCETCIPSFISSTFAPQPTQNAIPGSSTAPHLGQAETDKKNAVAKKDSEYIIPDSNSRYLTESDISGLSLQQLNYAKNEIYARRGRKFDSVELQEYFGSKSWYRGTIEPSQFANDMLNDYEIKNADLLSAREFAIDSGGYKLR